MFSRRVFLRLSGNAALTMGAWPFLLERRLWAAATAAAPADPLRSDRALVLVILRGAMDGLSLVAPLEERLYVEGRPNLALRSGGDRPALRLDGQFGLHPSMAPLLPSWQDGTLAFVHQCGSPDGTRSHFDAQDYLESGTPGRKSTDTGFLNRALGSGKGGGIRGVAMQPNLPLVLMGPASTVSMDSLKEFRIAGAAGGPRGPGGNEADFEAMYQQAADTVFRGVGAEVFESMKKMKGLEESEAGGGAELGYPKAKIGGRLRDIATLLKADLGYRVAVTDMGGWDTHVNQGAAEKGQLSDRFKELAEALAAFRKDLGARWGRVCVVAVTEFGRTMRENGNRGTDHGHGSVAMVLGGNVRGKRVHGHWKELKPENLFEGRDLPVTTDVREVLGDVLRSHLGVRDLGSVFPGYAFSGSSRVIRG